MPPAKAEMALRSARKIGKPRLLQGLQALQRADSLLKGGADDPRTAMEFLIVELTSQEARSAAGWIRLVFDDLLRAMKKGAWQGALFSNLSAAIPDDRRSS